MPDIRIQIPAYHSGQKIVEKERNRHNVIACGRRWGKTVYGVRRCIEFMLKGFPVAWFAPNYKYLAEAWRMFETILAPIIKNKNKTDRRIELITGGSIDFWSLEDVDSGRGYKYRHIVVDEAAKVRYLRDWWIEASRPMLSDFKGSSDWLSTPKGHDFFWELFERGKSTAQKDRAWSCWQMPSITNDSLPWLAEELEDARGDMPPRSFAQEYEAQFLDAAAGGLFDPDKWQYREDVPKLALWVRFWDLAVSIKESGDYTVGGLVGLEPDGTFYIRDVVRFKAEWPEAKRIIHQTADLDAKISEQEGGLIILAAESVATQTGLVQDLNYNSRHYFIPEYVKGDKKERASMWAWRQCSGKVAMKRAGWNSEFTTECHMFDGKGLDHDDQVDAISGAVAVLFREKGRMADPKHEIIPGSHEYYERLAENYASR